MNADLWISVNTITGDEWSEALILLLNDACVGPVSNTAIQRR